MKTLKKTLCLVLAVVMVVGVLVLPASAADTKTEIETKYNEALTVLNAKDVWIMQGDEKGNLKADDDVTRAEAAAFVARMLEKDADVLDWPTDGLNFADVDPNGWAAHYIAYCVSEGIIEGITPDTFAPNDPVNGYDLAKMVLVAIGANEGDDFNGGNYASKVHKAARDAKILNNLTISSANMKRGEVAQLVLNGLLYTEGGEATLYTVKDQNGKVIYSGSSSADAHYAYLNALHDEGATEEDENHKSELIIGASYEGSLADVVYDGLRPGDDTADGFGRPATTWVNNKYDETKENYVAVIPKTADATYPTGITGKDAEKLTDYTVIYNGVEGGLKNEADVENGNGLYVDENTGIIGFEVEVFDAEKLIIVREAYLAEVGKAEKEGADITVTVHRAGQTEGKEFTVTAEDEIYETVAAYQGKYVGAYANFNENTVLEVAKLDVVNATITRRDIGKAKFDSSIVAGGRTYGFNNQALVKTNADGIVYLGVLSKTELGASTLYLLNGYVLFVDQSTPETPNTPKTPTAGYAYLYDIKQVPGSDTTGTDNKWDSEGGNVGTGSKTNDTFKARLLLADDNGTDLADGVTVVLKGNENAKYEDFEKYLGTLVFYTVEKDVYTIESIKGTSVGNVITQVSSTDGYSKGSGKLEITNKKSEGTVPGEDEATNVAFDGKTVFIVVTTGLNGKNPNFKVTGKTYSIYDVPSYNTETAIVTAVADVKVDGETATSGGTVTDAKTIARVVLIVDVDTTVKEVSDDIYFIVKDPNAIETKMYKDPNGNLTISDSNDNIIWFYIYNAVVNGEIQQVMVEKKVADAAFASDSVLLQTGVETETYDGTKVIVGLGEEIDEELLLEFTSLSEYKNDHITFNTEDGQEDYLVSTAGDKAFTYNTEDGSINEIKLSDITAKAAEETYSEGCGIRDSKHTVLSALFLDVTPEAE